MKKGTCALSAALMATALTLPMAAQAADQELEKKVNALEKELATVKQQMNTVESKSLGKWLTIGGDYRFRLDSLRGETASFTSGVGLMQNMVGDFLANSSGMFTSPVAGQNIGTLQSPSPLEFMMAGKANTLFTSNQFDMILNQYMPQAMFSAFTGTNLSNPAQSVMAQLQTILPGGQAAVNAALQQTALSGQQSAILGTLGTKVLPTVMGMKFTSGPFNGMTLQQAFQGMMASLPPGVDPNTVNALAMQMAMQAFMGQNSPYVAGNNGTLANVTIPSYKPKNDTLYTNRFGLDLHAKATQDVTVTARLVAYKVFGSQDDAAVTNGPGTPFFADRVGVFDGTIGHVPSTSLLDVDRAYATWANIADQPVWISVGRRPSTNGAPSNLRLNNPRPGNGGVPSLLVDYAFDGMTLGWAPDMEALPGAYTKVCYGRAFDSGFSQPNNSLRDTDMLGVAILPIDTDAHRIWLQWNRAFNIFDFPAMRNTFFGNTGPSANLGDMDWYGVGYMGAAKKVGPGTLNYFADFGLSVSHPNSNVSQNAGFQGLMTGQFFAQETPSDKTGWAVYAGARYDFLPTLTKLGFEYNHGSKNWMTFAPAADDIWTAKVGTRGNVYEGYLIQELNLRPISSYLSKTFFRLGYQYYDFEYTGSNNWVGAPQKISSLQPTDLMLMTPLKNAQNLYFTFEVKF